jgi:aminopeptidase N
MLNKICVILVTVFIFNLETFSQQIKEISNAEKNAYERIFKASKVTYPGDSTFDVTYYKLNLTLTSKPNYLTGIVTVSGKMLQASSKIFLDLQDTLIVDSILSGSNRLNFTHTNAKLNIDLGKDYNVGENFSIDVYYQGVPGASGFGSFEFSTHGNNEPAIWSLSEPYGASDWWPCKDTPADKADSSDVWVTCNSGLIAVSNGTLEKVVSNLNDTKTYEWKNSYPIAQYLISIAVSDYSIYTLYYHYNKTDSMPVINYIYPENLDTLKDDLNKTISMLKIFSNLFGQYPFVTEKYGHAEFGWNGGMEHQTCASVGAFTEDVLSHELSHQWFGDKITCKDWQDIWLNEGFATYCAGLFREFYHGDSSYVSYINSLIPGAKQAVGSIYVQDISSVNQIFDGDRTYNKGAMVLYMLRGIAGDSIFFKILKTYANDPSLIYNVATTQDFENVADSVYGSSLSYFFDEWIYGENYPKYTVTWDYQQENNNSYRVTLQIDQQINPNPAFFIMPIQIKISSTLGDTLVEIFNNQQNQQFVFNINGRPMSLIFDPNNLILRDTTNATTGILEKHQDFSFTLEQNYPNPFNPTTIIKYSIPANNNSISGEASGGLVTLKIYDILGRLVSTLVDESKQPGTYEVKFPSDGSKSNLSDGIYFYKLTYGNYSIAKKMVFLK